MRTVSASTKPDGTRRLLLELAPGERMVIVHPDRFYKLGDPMTDQVIAGYILQEATNVAWCSIEQRWVA